MTGILASSSAFRMHSSKNPAAAVPLRPSRPAPPPRPPRESRAAAHPPGQGTEPPAAPPPRCRAGTRLLQGSAEDTPSVARDHLMHTRTRAALPARVPAPQGRASRGGRARGLGAGAGGRGLLFRWLTSARILSSFSLFRTLELSPCSKLRKAPSASRRRLSRSMRTFTSAWVGGDRRKWGPGEQLSSPVEAFPGHPLVQAGLLVSGLGWKLPHPASCLEPLTGWPGPSPCTRQGSSSAPPPWQRRRAHYFPKWWLHRLPLAGETGRDT